ncbi:unnamed protein product [Peniophora sp. CBMAI 1063]|nr:unnamed protein product [Peniophora sp. CBMAI 1063]
MNPSDPTMQGAVRPAVELVTIQEAVQEVLSGDSSASRAVRELLKDPLSISDPRLLKLLADAVAQGLRFPRSASPVCMHAHGMRIATELERYGQDGGPDYLFTAMEDVDLSESEPFYSAGVMITSPKFRLIRRYPPTVLFYVIVDSAHRGVRLCTLAVIQLLGFTPEYPTRENAYPACRGFYTAGEAFHYLHEALLHRGVIAQLPRIQTAPTVSAVDQSAQTVTPETTPQNSPNGSPIAAAGTPLVAWGHVELAQDELGYYERDMNYFTRA